MCTSLMVRAASWIRGCCRCCAAIAAVSSTHTLLTMTITTCRECGAVSGQHCAYGSSPAAERGAGQLAGGGGQRAALSQRRGICAAQGGCCCSAVRQSCWCSPPASVWLLPAPKVVQHADHDQVPHCCALQDPTGAIGGTLTKAVLQAEPDLRQGAVVRLRRVTVLRTPPPRSLNHLCITL